MTVGDRYYKVTAQDGKDDERIRQLRLTISTARGAVASLVNPEGEPLIGAQPILSAAQDVIDASEARIERIEHEMEARRQEFYTDRKRLQRAFRVLRSSGFKAVLNETPYESTSPSKLGEDFDFDSGQRYVFAYANHMKHAFSKEGRYATWVNTSTDTLQQSIYLHWGPSSNVNIAAEVIEALEGQGLRTKWDGTGSDCVEVFSATDKEEVAA